MRDDMEHNSIGFKLMEVLIELKEVEKLQELKVKIDEFLVNYEEED